MKLFLTQRVGISIGVVLTLFFLGAPSAHALTASVSISPSTLYPGTTVSGTATISSPYWGPVNAKVYIYYNGSMCNNRDAVLPARGSWSVSCSNTAGSVGSTAQYSALTYINEVDQGWSGSSELTVVAKPVITATASISGPSSPIPYDTSTYLTISSTNATNCSVSGGGSWSSKDTYGSSGTWQTGRLTSATTFTVSCSGAWGATNNPSSSVTVNVNPPPKSNQTITFNPPSSATYGSSFSVSPSSTSGLTVSVSASGGCSISGSTVTMTSGTNSCSLTASQAGNSSYNAASDVSRTVSALKADPVIYWSDFYFVYGGSITQPSASINGSFSFSNVSYDVGTRNITAFFTPSSSNSDNYNSISKTVSMTVQKATPSISWNTPATITYGTAIGSTQLNATANVGGTFSYNPASGAVLAAGSRTLSTTFSPTDTANYNSATKSVTLTVDKASQSISFGALANKTLGDPAFSVSASASSGLSVSFTSQTASVCTISGSTVTLKAIGTCTIRASQGGDGNWSAATSVDRSFTVGLPPQPLTTTVNTGSGSFECSTNSGSSYTACASVYTAGTRVYIRALPSTNYTFGGWQDCGAPVDNVCTNVLMNYPRTVSANFSAITHTLSVSKVGSGSVTGSGISCGIDCAESYIQGTSVTLSATPAAGYRFGSWSGACTGDTCTVTMNAGKSVTASFTKINVTATLSPVPPFPQVVSGGITPAYFQTTVGGDATGTVTYSGHSCGGGNISGNVSTSGSFFCTYSRFDTYRPEVTVTQQGVSVTATTDFFLSSFPVTSPVEGKSYLPGEQFYLTGTYPSGTQWPYYAVKINYNGNDQLLQQGLPTGYPNFNFGPLTMPATPGSYTITTTIYGQLYTGMGSGVKQISYRTTNVTVAYPAPTLSLNPICQTNEAVTAVPYHAYNQLTWNAIAGATAYKVYVQEYGSTPQQTITNATWSDPALVTVTDETSARVPLNRRSVPAPTPPVTTYWDNGYGHGGPFPAIGKNYSYKVTAIIGGQESPASNIKSQEGYADACPGPDGKAPVFPNLTALSPVLKDQYGKTGAVLSPGPIIVNGTIKNENTSTVDGKFLSLSEYRVVGSSSWSKQSVALVPNTTALGIESRPTNEYTIPYLGVGTYEFRLTADHLLKVPESSETDNVSPTVTVNIVDFTPTLTAPSLVLVTKDTRITAKTTLAGNVTEAVIYSGHSCGEPGLVATDISPDKSSFSCKYQLLGPKKPKISATYFGIPKTAEANLTVQIRVPDVKLFISPAVNCDNKLTTTPIIKGLPALLCWTPVTGTLK